MRFPVRFSVRSAVAVAGLAIVLPLGLVETAPASAGPAETEDYCRDQCYDILPPGASGQASLLDLLLFQVFGVRPKHSGDQVDKYEKLVWNHAGLTNDQISKFFNSSSFGVPKDQAESETRPRADVTIVRDKATGVPHINGTTRDGTTFGAGYAGAQDRLFLMDVLRHVGRGKLTSFAGGGVGNRVQEQTQWKAAPYTEADLERQFEVLDDRYGAEGRRLQNDIRSYVDGVNAYIRHARRTASLPGEYTAIGRPLGPELWKPADVVATGSLIGAMFGTGGGREVVSAVALVEARAKYGVDEGTRIWRAFRNADDAEADSTVHNGKEFPYGGPSPTRATALPDRGTVVDEPVVVDPSGSAENADRADRADRARTPRSGNGRTVAPTKADTDVGKGMFDGGIFPKDFRGELSRGMSNALMVSGKHTDSGNPVAVFGPQTGFTTPQLLMLQELNGPGIHVRGVAFAGTNLGVLIGRGPDYAWSATSSLQDITDTYAVPLCEPSGSEPGLRSDHYRFRGECMPMEKLERHNAWKPNLADSTPAGSYTLRTYRTKLGLVTHRGRVDGRPVAFTALRSTYGHEIDSGLGFTRFDQPADMRSPQDFQRAAAKISFAFNWFYIDAEHTAYFNSGANPIRPKHADSALPTKADRAYEWVDWDPETNIAKYTPFEQHPQVIDQDYTSNWNNKQAPKYDAADGNYAFGAVQRSDLLTRRVRDLIASDRPVTRARLVGAMEDAGLTDLRAERVLPLLLKVLRSAPVDDPRLADAVRKLEAWKASGGRRSASEDPAETGRHEYDHRAAIQIMDAWWPLLMEAEFQPAMGSGLFDALKKAEPLDHRPDHRGSHFFHGWGGYASKDLRSLLGDSVRDPLPRAFCGDGVLAKCRKSLLDTLDRALDVPATTLYPGDADCEPGDQFCNDQTIHSPIGAITQKKMHWANRSTYQQVVEFPAHR